MARKNLIADDFKFMLQAISEARKALSQGEVPVGAVVVEDSKIIARGYNQPLARTDPTAHAEIVALRAAAKKLKNYRLPAVTLYVTVEPCPMCMGAIIQARIKKLVYGTSDPKNGAVVSSLKFDLKKANHQPEIVGGLCRQECQQLLKDFFQKKRASKRLRVRQVEKQKAFK
ncbi:MAG: tRNA adenosine(34) deaminase TadA [Candidatus Saccharicenans sp.]